MSKAIIVSVVSVVVLASNQCMAAFEDLEKKAMDDKTSDFTAYRPNYFGFIVHDTDSGNEGGIKFQLSLKYKLVKSDDKYLRDLYFGYTQKSYWDIQKASQPFRESNYSPEFFKIFRFSDFEDTSRHLKYIQAAIWRHESTGEAGSGSHGWNISYVEPVFTFGKFSVSPKLWVPALFLSKSATVPDNRDIFDYYGYGELNVSYYSNTGNQHSIMLRTGTKGGTFGFQYQWNIDLNHILKPFKPLLGIQDRKWNPELFLQIWSGEGESLKTYNMKTRSIIIGVSAIR